MASMDDLVATISGGLHAGQQGNDLRDLHAKLASTLHPNKAPFRPIPPPVASALSPSHTAGPLPPPAPASSWNDNMVPNGASAASASNAWGGMGNSPRQGGMMYAGKRETGFSIPAPKDKKPGNAAAEPGSIPYHANVLPTKASPKEAGGFGDDAFKPLWEENRAKGTK